MDNEYKETYTKLHKIYKKYQKKYKCNPDSHQMCCMWSTEDPPDTIEDTEQIYEIEKAFEINLDEDEALVLYDMELDEAAQRIIEIKRRKC